MLFHDESYEYWSCRFCNWRISISFSDIALSHATTDVDEHNTVLTVPLDFDAAQRKAATKAAEAAGFRVVQVIVFLFPVLPWIIVLFESLEYYE